MEEHPKKKLLDQVRDVIRLQFGMRKHQSTGFDVPFCFITNVILQRLEHWGCTDADLRSAIADRLISFTVLPSNS